MPKSFSSKFQPTLAEIEAKTYFVHATKSFPEAGRLIAGAQELGISSPTYSPLRQTLHFAIGSVIPNAISSGDRGKCPYALIVPFKSLIRQLAEVSFLDSYVIGDLILDHTMFLVIPKKEIISEAIIDSRITVVTYDPSREGIREISKKVIRKQNGWVTRIEHQDFEPYAPVFIESEVNEILVDNINFFNPLLESYPQLSIGGNDVQCVKGNADSKLLPLLTRRLLELRNALFETSFMLTVTMHTVNYLLNPAKEYLTSYFPKSNSFSLLETEKNKLFTLAQYWLETNRFIRTHDKLLEFTLIDAASSRANLLAQLDSLVSSSKKNYFAPIHEQEMVISSLSKSFPFHRIFNFIRACQNAGFKIEKQEIDDYFLYNVVLQLSTESKPMQEDRQLFFITQLMKDNLYRFLTSFPKFLSFFYVALILPREKFWLFLNLPSVGFILECHDVLIPNHIEELDQLKDKIVRLLQPQGLNKVSHSIPIIKSDTRFIRLEGKKVNFLNEIMSIQNQFPEGFKSVDKLLKLIFNTLFDDNQSLEETIAQFFQQNPAEKKAIVEAHGSRLKRLFSKKTSWYDVINKYVPNFIELTSSKVNVKANPYPKPANFEEAINYFLDSQRSTQEKQLFYRKNILKSFDTLNAEQSHTHLRTLAQQLASFDHVEVELKTQMQLLFNQVLANLPQDVLNKQMRLFKLALSQTIDPDESKVMSEILTNIISHCSKARRRKKRSPGTCENLFRQFTGDDEVLLRQQNKINRLVAAERQSSWQNAISSVMHELNYHTKEWFPLLETAKSLNLASESMEFINLHTQEKQICQFSGKTSVDYLKSLHGLYGQITPEQLQDYSKKLADTFKGNTALMDQTQKNTNQFGGDIMLGVGLSAKSIMDFIKTQGCGSQKNNSLTEVECYFNIAAITNMHLITALQLGDLVGKEFFLVDSTLLQGLSRVNAALSSVGGVFFLMQDGLDIAELVNAKNEGERAVYTTQLVIDGTITFQMGLSLATEECVAAASGALLVPLMGLSVGLPALVNNYASLFQSALAVGRFFNKMYTVQKTQLYQLTKTIETVDKNGKTTLLNLPISKYYMRPSDYAGFNTVNFRDKFYTLEGPWIYSSKSQAITGCPTVDYNKKHAFDFREAVGLPPIISLTKDELSNEAWLLPSSTFYVNYDYQQEPSIIFRRDAELDTLRLLQRNKNFISDKYCFPTSYGIYKFTLEQSSTSITIVLDKLSRQFIIPTLSTAIHGLLTYTFDAKALKEGQTTIYLNPGVTIRLFQSNENYSWVLNAQNLPQETIEFTEKGLTVGNIAIQPSQKNFLKNQLNYVDKNGHGFILDLIENKKILTTINYSALEQQQQALQQFVEAQVDTQSVLRVINYRNPQDGYQGVATYVKKLGKVFYTNALANTLNDAVLVYLQKKTAFYYHRAQHQLWCTDTDANRLSHFYVFPDKINSVQSQGNYLLVNVANRFYYKIDTQTNKLFLFALQDANLLSFYLHMNDPVNYTSIKDNDSEMFELICWDWHESNQKLQQTIGSIFSAAKQSSLIYQSLNGKKQYPEINDVVALLITPKISPFIWINTVQEAYQLVSMQNSHLDPKKIKDNKYLQDKVVPGYYLGRFSKDLQSKQQVLSYFVKENSTDTSGKIHLQTVTKQGVVSFVNTPAQLIVNLELKNAVWDNNRLMVLTMENIFKTIDAKGQTELLGFSTDWTQSHVHWWQAMYVYLKNLKLNQLLISVPGITDPQGQNLMVHYDPAANQFVIMVADEPSNGLVYRGKIGKYYFFTQSNCAYRVSGVPLSEMSYLFDTKVQKKPPLLEKIAEYPLLKPLGIPTQLELEIMRESPQFSITWQGFSMNTLVADLVFDSQSATWQILRIKSNWLFEHVNPLAAVSNLFAKLDKNLRLRTNQYYTPIPLENSPFWLVEKDRLIRTCEKQAFANEFIYLGQTNALTGTDYYFFDSTQKTLISVMSQRLFNVGIGYSYLKNNVHVGPVKSNNSVKQAIKLDEESVLLEIDPQQIKGENIPLLKNCSQLLLRFTSNSAQNNLIVLPKQLLDHYPIILCQTNQTLSISLPSDFLWTASKGDAELLISNGHTRLIITRGNDNFFPDITLQVKDDTNNLTQIFTDTVAAIAAKLNTQHLLKQIPILNYWWTEPNLFLEKTQVTSNKHFNNYQKEDLLLDVAVSRLSERFAPKHDTSFLSHLSKAGVACISAATLFALTATTGLSYVFIRRFRRINLVAIQNNARAVSIPLMTQLTAVDAKKTYSENTLVSYNEADFFDANDCFITEMGLEKMGLCVNEKKSIGWFENNAWYAEGVERENLINHLEFKEENLIIYHSQGTQFLSYADMNPTPYEKIYPYIDDNLKILFWKSVQEQQIFQNFYQSARFFTLNWFVNQISLHTPLGNIFCQFGLNVDWQQRDDSYLMARCLLTMMQVLKQNYTLEVPLTNLGACLLEISIVSPSMQNTLFGFPYAKQVIRLGADFLQFGFNQFIFIPNLLDAMFVGHKRIHELTWSIRLLFSLSTMADDLSYWYLGVTLFILPQLPFVLESVGIPVTHYVRTTLDNFSQLYLLKYLMDTMTTASDAGRLKQQSVECFHAQQRVEEGQKRSRRFVKSLLHFFKPEAARDSQIGDNPMQIRVVHH